MNNEDNWINDSEESDKPAAAFRKKTAGKQTAFSPEDVRRMLVENGWKAVVLSEILGKPKARRGRGW